MAILKCTDCGATDVSVCEEDGVSTNIRGFEEMLFSCGCGRLHDAAGKPAGSEYLGESYWKNLDAIDEVIIRDGRDFQIWPVSTEMIKVAEMIYDDHAIEVGKSRFRKQDGFEEVPSSPMLLKMGEVTRPTLIEIGRHFDLFWPDLRDRVAYVTDDPNAYCWLGRGFEHALGSTLVDLGRFFEDGDFHSRLKSGQDYPTNVRISLVGDVVSSPSRLIEAARCLKNIAGVVVEDCFVIVDRLMGAEEALKSEGIRLHALFSLIGLLRIYQQRQLINEDVVEAVIHHQKHYPDYIAAYRCGS